MCGSYVRGPGLGRPPATFPPSAPGAHPPWHSQLNPRSSAPSCTLATPAPSPVPGETLFSGPGRVDQGKHQEAQKRCPTDALG